MAMDGGPLGERERPRGWSSPRQGTIERHRELGRLRITDPPERKPWGLDEMWIRDLETRVGSIVLIRTGFASRWPDAVKYLGTAERGEAAVAKLHFPGLHPDAAQWLVSNRPIKAVGIDTASIDFGQSKGFETHRTLTARDIPAFENLASLDRLPPTGAIVIALPMKIGGGSGAPLRAVAVLPAARAN